MDLIYTIEKAYVESILRTTLSEDEWVVIKDGIEEILDNTLEEYLYSI